MSEQSETLSNTPAAETPPAPTGSSLPAEPTNEQERQAEAAAFYKKAAKPAEPETVDQPTPTGQSAVKSSEAAAELPSGEVEPSGQQTDTPKTDEPPPAKAEEVPLGKRAEKRVRTLIELNKEKDELIARLTAGQSQPPAAAPTAQPTAQPQAAAEAQTPQVAADPRDVPANWEYSEQVARERGDENAVRYYADERMKCLGRLAAREELTRHAQEQVARHNQAQWLNAQIAPIARIAASNPDFDCLDLKGKPINEEHPFTKTVLRFASENQMPMGNLGDFKDAFLQTVLAVKSGQVQLAAQQTQQARAEANHLLTATGLERSGSRTPPPAKAPDTYESLAAKANAGDEKAAAELRRAEAQVVMGGRRR